MPWTLRRIFSVLSCFAVSSRLTFWIILNKFRKLTHAFSFAGKLVYHKQMVKLRLFAAHYHPVRYVFRKLEDTMRTSGGYCNYRGGGCTMKGYHNSCGEECIGRCSVHWKDIMSITTGHREHVHSFLAATLRLYPFCWSCFYRLFLLPASSQ